MEKFTQGDDAGAGLDLRGSLPGRERGEACQDIRELPRTSGLVWAWSDPCGWDSGW